MLSPEAQEAAELGGIGTRRFVSSPTEHPNFPARRCGITDGLGQSDAQASMLGRGEALWQAAIAHPAPVLREFFRCRENKRPAQRDIPKTRKRSRSVEGGQLLIGGRGRFFYEQRRPGALCFLHRCEFAIE
jgi:hypothetical protein